MSSVIIVGSGQSAKTALTVILRGRMAAAGHIPRGTVGNQMTGTITKTVSIWIIGMDCGMKITVISRTAVHYAAMKVFLSIFPIITSI